MKFHGARRVLQAPREVESLIKCSYNKKMRITCDPFKRQQTLQERGLDMRRAAEIFAGAHFTRVDDRLDYRESRFITAGWLDRRLVVFVWTPRGTARRIISMRHCHEREAKKLRQYLVVE